MSFNPNVPNTGDFLAISQKQILANFQAINSSWFADHVPLTAIDDVGKHNALTFRVQGSDPTTSSSQCALYNKLVTSVPQLFFRSSSNATPIQMSNSNLNTIQTGATGNNQSSFLAGPFTIYMGYVLNCPNLQLVTLTPSSTLIYVGLTTVLNNERVVTGFNIAAAENIAGNQFTIRYPALASFTPAPTIYYMAVGQ